MALIIGNQMVACQEGVLAVASGHARGGRRAGADRLIVGGKNMNRYVKPAICVATLFTLCGGAQAQDVQPEQKIDAQRIGAPPEAANMRLVGYSDLQAR